MRIPQSNLGGKRKQSQVERKGGTLEGMWVWGGVGVLGAGEGIGDFWRGN